MRKNHDRLEAGAGWRGGGVWRGSFAGGGERRRLRCPQGGEGEFREPVGGQEIPQDPKGSTPFFRGVTVPINLNVERRP